MSGAVLGVVLCAFAGVVCLVSAVRESVVTSRLRRHGVRVEGTVVERVHSTGGESDWLSVIEFADRDGLAVRFRAHAGGAALALRIGRRVPVVYPPGTPSAARVFTLRHRVLPMLFLL